VATTRKHARGRLADKVALVTGAAQGIGAAIGRAMAAEGAVVYFTDRNVRGAEENAAAAGGHAFMLDVTDEVAWLQAAERLEGEHGRLDILVNNAGVELSRPIGDTSFAEWRQVLAVNLDAVFLGCKAMLPALRSAGAKRDDGASVINISSVAGIIGYPDQVAYNASKAAVMHMAKSLAVEWGRHGFNIRVNSIHPGAIRTQMVEEYVETVVHRDNRNADDVWREIAATNPLGRLGRVEDVAMGAVYLASDEAAYVNGLELVIDGGWIAG
jgi:3(or 17)beta-hydroxysteroid dehydrogenase